MPADAKPFAYASSNPAWIERLGWFDTALTEFYREAPETDSEPVMRSAPALTPAATPQPIPYIEPPIAGKSVSATSPSYIVTIADVPLRLQYGEMVIRSETRLRVVKRDPKTVYVEFGSTVVPLSASVVQ